jgi:hypothetical protein
VPPLAYQKVVGEGRQRGEEHYLGVSVVIRSERASEAYRNLPTGQLSSQRSCRRRAGDGLVLPRAEIECSAGWSAPPHEEGAFVQLQAG